MNFSRKDYLYFILIPVLFITIYFQTFFANYAYLDEIHQLWHNKDGSNFTMFLVQGRVLTGWLLNKLFGAVTTIGQLKYLRIFSLIGWMFASCVWAVVFNRWAVLLKLDKNLAWLTNLFVVCCIPVAVYIGWSSALELFLATLAALLSGHILFNHLYRQKNRIEIPFATFLFSLLLGVASLFFYQTAFGVFLLPFFIYYFKHNKAKPDRVVIIGVALYLVTYVVYYFLFKYSLQVGATVAGNRTGITYNIKGKLSFLFSQAFPQAFNFNILYSPRSVFSQVLYPLVFVFWLVSVFIRNKGKGLGNNLLQVIVTIILLALIYLPLMIAAESFASYRTVFALNVAVFIMVADALLYFVKTASAKKAVTALFSVLLLAMAVYNFNFQFVNPLKVEYKALRSFMEANFNTNIKKVHFIRAGKNLFADQYSIRTVRDEFGVPSTFRDWVPEPMVKQMVFEITGNRKMAEQIWVVQYENFTAYQQAKSPVSSTELVISMNDLFNKSLQK